MHFVSSEYFSEKGNTTHFIRKLTNSVLLFKNRVVCGSPLHEIEMCYGCGFFFTKNLLHLKKMERWPRDNKLFFCFWVKICQVQSYGTVLLKKLFKPPMFKHAVMARWYRVGFYKDHRKDVWLEYGQIIIYILRFF